MDVSLDQAFDLSRLAQGAETKGKKFRLYISGRLADTSEEAIQRGKAWDDAEVLISKFKNDSNFEPSLKEIIGKVEDMPEKYDLDPDDLNAINEELEKIITTWAQNRAAKDYQPMSWPQAKKSSGTGSGLLYP